MITTLKGKLQRLTADKNFSEILVGSASALIARVAATALGVISTIVVARRYGAEAVGILAMINSFLMLVTIFTVLGTGTSILRLIPEYITKYSLTSAFRVYRKTQYLVAVVSLVTGTLFFFASGWVADTIFSKPHLAYFFALASCFVFFKALMDLNTQAVRGLRLIRTFAFMQVMPALSMLVLLMVGWGMSRNPGVPVYAQLLSYGITGLAGAWIMDRSFRHQMRPGDLLHALSVREILAISTPMLMTASMQFFIGQIGVVMLGRFRTVSEVGYYSIAVRLATLTVFVLQAINSMAAPRFSELYHSGRMDELFAVAQKSTKLIFWTSVPILCGLVVFGGPIIRTFFGEEFMVAYPFLVVLVVGQFVNSISGSTGYFMNMAGHQKALRNIIVVTAAMHLLLSLLLISQLGGMGAAIASMISMVFWNGCALLYIRMKHGRTIGYLPLFGLKRGRVSS